MTTRRTILVALIVALAVANLAFLMSWPSPKAQRATAPTEKASPGVPDQPFRNPFPTAREVRLFVNTDQDAEGNPIYSNPKGRVLTASQRAELESLIAVHTIAPDESLIGCFIPHHFFRYYDKAGRQVGEIEVCFCCAGVRQSEGSSVRLTDGQMLVGDFGKLVSFVASLGERADVQCEGEV